MRQVRTSVFETNSSMTHSIVMCPTAGYEDWLEGKSLFNEWKRPQFVSVEEGRKFNADILRKWWDGTIVRKDEADDNYLYFDDEDEEEVLESFNEENIAKYEQGEFSLVDFYLDKYTVMENLYYDYDFWNDNVCEYYETFSEEYEDGDVKVTAFGYYGHD